MPPPSTFRGNLSSFAGVLDGGPELAHPVYQVGDGTLAHPGDSVHGVGSAAEGQRGRQEAGHRAGVAHEEVDVGGGDHAPPALYADLSPFAVGGEAEAEFGRGRP